MIKEILTPTTKKASPIYYFGPLAMTAGWILFSFITLFMVGTKYLLNPYVIFSILSRIGFSLINVYFVYKIFYKKENQRTRHNSYTRWAGYGVMLTYVSYILPQVVIDFHNPRGVFTSPLLTIFVIITSIFPAALYLLLSRDKTRLALKGYTQKEVAARKKMKKDKKLFNDFRKAERKNRKPLENFWHEWIEPLAGAIMWVLVVWHFVFQLYTIPSESMVPTFLISDKVIVTKSFSGPAIPLTRWNLPALSKPKTGDIVTFIHPESDNPDSKLHHGSVFSRLFQTIVLMLTLTQVDIDMVEGANGEMEHKARNLVKRVIGEPGERICMVNDTVYKQTSDFDWKPIDQIPSQEAYGKSSLFYNDYPQMQYLTMNEPLRETLDLAKETVAQYSAESLEKELIAIKEELILMADNMDQETFLLDGQMFLESNYNRFFQSVQDIQHAYRDTIFINTTSSAGRPLKTQTMKQALENYQYFFFYQNLFNLTSQMAYPGSFSNFLDKEIVTTVGTADEDPYNQFAAIANGTYKLAKLRLYKELLSALPGERSVDAQYFTVEMDQQVITDLWCLGTYLNGISTSANPENASYFSFFGYGNLPPFPAEENSYIPEGEYFLIGDNRYNSLDGRYQGDRITRHLDSSDRTAFGTKIVTAWAPYTIPTEYLQGRPRVLIFPFNRIRVF